MHRLISHSGIQSMLYVCICVGVPVCAVEGGPCPAAEGTQPKHTASRVPCVCVVLHPGSVCADQTLIRMNVYWCGWVAVQLEVVLVQLLSSKVDVRRAASVALRDLLHAAQGVHVPANEPQSSESNPQRLAY